MAQPEEKGGKATMENHHFEGKSFRVLAGK